MILSRMIRNVQYDKKMVQYDMNVQNDASKLRDVFGMTHPK